MSSIIRRGGPTLLRGTKPEAFMEDVEETYREKHEVEKDEEGHSEVRSSGHATTAVI